MKKKLLIAVPLLCLVALLAWFFRPRHEWLGEAYVSDRSLILYSSVAQVRQEVTVLHYGDHVDVLAKRNDSAKVRTQSGVTGWVDGSRLMEPQLWQRSTKLLATAQGIPVQARGRTKVATNLRVAPGRTEPRLYQFGRGVAVEVIGRAVADWVQVSDEKDNGGDAEITKKEDWYLVRALATRPRGEESTTRATEANTTTEAGEQSVPIAGWVVSRFVELDLADPIREGMASANVRAVAWFELNRLADPAGDKAQYVVAGTRGPEGQVCDFTTLRVYTWNAKRSRYETAFIENNLCGQMPVRTGKSEAGQPEFWFTVKDGDREEHRYRLIQTVVRRIREGQAAKRPATTAARRAKP